MSGKKLRKLMTLMIMALFAPTGVWGYSEFNSRIPNGEVFSCDTCHGMGNNFFNDFLAAGNTWTTALANQDSDQDDWTNGEELLDAEGTWQEGQPDPGNPADVTNPGDPESHPPEATVTPAPTATPTFAATDTPTPVPTDPATTPAPTETPRADEPVLDLMLNQTDFGANDPFELIISIEYSGVSISVELYVILDVYGEYWFYPGWTQALDFQTLMLDMDFNDVILAFQWPAGAGSASNLKFWAGLLEAGSVNLLGNVDSVTFGYDS